LLPDEIAAEYRSQGYWGPETLPARLDQVCRKAWAGDVFVDGERRVTFGEAAALIERLAGHLVARDVRGGDVVSWQLPNWWEAAIVHHAALRIGAIPNPLNQIFRARELSFVLAEARPGVLVVPQSFRGFDHASVATRLAAEIGFEVIVARGSAPGATSLDELLAEPAAALPWEGDPSLPALLLYTSGTTSDPKGVLHSHETLLYEITSLATVHAITSADRYLGGSPVTHIAGLVYGLLMPFVLGTQTLLMERWDTGTALRLIERERATFQTGTPTFLQTLATHPDLARTDRSSFRLFSTGGAHIDTEMVRQAERAIGCTVKRAYGSTEAPTLSATSFEDRVEVRLGTDGRPIPPAEVRIVGVDDAVLSAGLSGEIWARSPEIFLGYRNPALDENAFAPGGWFRTGDLGVVDSEGYLRVTGRVSDVIIRGGENISAREIEDLLASHPAVAAVAVVGLPDEVLGERACAVVVLQPDATLSFEEMQAWLSSREIARQKIPERLEIRAALPHTASGKVAKAALREELLG
jgi:acyl-CoA synthetase (AMP-forming)/AMP-acid ligase II